MLMSQLHQHVHSGIRLRRLLFMGCLWGGSGRVVAADTGDYADLLKAPLARYPQMQLTDF